MFYSFGYMRHFNKTYEVDTNPVSIESDRIGIASIRCSDQNYFISAIWLKPLNDSVVQVVKIDYDLSSGQFANVIVSNSGPNPATVKIQVVEAPRDVF